MNINNPELIHYDISQYTNKIIPNIFVLLMIFLYVLFEYIDQTIKMFFAYGDYWMLELIIMAYLNHKIFKIKIYKHQLLSIYLVSVPFLKSITMVLSFCDENNYLKDGKSIIDIKIIQHYLNHYLLLMRGFFPLLLFYFF